PELLRCMQEAAFLAPAHNPAYIAAMQMLSERMPEMPLVAAFETEFHRTVPDKNRYYAIPKDWADRFLVRRWGYHGASHRYIATRSAEIFGRNDLRVISCHLGGSSSVCAIRDCKSVYSSFGMTPQTGLPHNSRIGEFDPYALPVLMKGLGKSLEDVLALLGSKCGLRGLSGGTGDMRDLEAAALAGDTDAKLAIDVFATAVRNHIGAFIVEMGGVDLISFTGGIGENQSSFRARVLANLEFLGIEVDPERNVVTRGEGVITKDSSRVAAWVIPTNEELIVARLTKKILEEGGEG
ncbi:MAG: acetate/propionate family kinase, partial [Planctomycetia bacterium]|nr:acetate/propionate family kinase [Planctomycetia bacterium]